MQPSPLSCYFVPLKKKSSSVFHSWAPSAYVSPLLWQTKFHTHEKQAELNYCMPKFWCWLKHCTTSRKVVGSFADGVIVIFHWYKPSGRTMALGSTQPPTEMSTRKISWGVKAAGAYVWQPYHLQVTTIMKSGNFNLPQTSGPVQTCTEIAFDLPVL